MAQGFSGKKGSHPRHSTSAAPRPSRHGKQGGPKKGGRVIKPKRQEAVKATALKKKLSSEHIKHTERQTAAKVGKAHFSLVGKPAHK